jgi:hypothetical protein
MRDLIAAMEKALRDALHTAGYVVLNDVNCRQKIDDLRWQEVLATFAQRFSRLRANAGTTESKI